MSDARLNKLGDYFIYFNILEEYGITFERFIELVENGAWGSWMNT